MSILITGSMFLIVPKETNTFKNRYCTNRRLWRLSGGLPLETNHKITAEVYTLQPDEMHIQVSQMQSTVVNRRGPIQRLGNARTHVGRRAKLTDMGYEILRQRKCSSRVSPRDDHFSNTSWRFFKANNNFLQKPMQKEH